MRSPKKYECSVCGREISKEEHEDYEGMCWECWDDRLTEESDSMFDELMGGAIMWLCQYCGHENDEDANICENCGALRDDDLGDSGDNKDSEDLFFDDEGI